MSLVAGAYIAVVILLGAVALAHGLAGWAPRELPRFLCYLFLAAPASCLKVALPGVTGTMSVSFLFLLAGIVELGLPETLVIGTLCALVQCFWRARTRPRAVQVLFSVATLALAVTVGNYVYYWQWLRGSSFESPIRLAAMASTFFFVNTFPIAVVIALTERKAITEVWSHCYRWSFPYYLVGAAAVGLFSSVNHTLNWQAWLLILPIVYVIYRSYRMYLDQLDAGQRKVEEQHRHAEELAAAHSQVVEALDAARTANAKLEAVIQASPLAILTVDRTGHVTSWNATAQRLFGWSGDEALRRPLPFIEARAGKILKSVVERTLNGELLSDVEVTQRRKDASEFEAAVWTAPLYDRSQQVSGIVVAVANVSDRKLLEEQVRFSAKMEAVGRLAGGVAHDFNNLLTVINGYGSMVLDSLKAKHDDYTSSQVEEILKAGNRAADLVSKLLAFSRRQVTAPRLLDINRLVQDIERMLRRLIGEHIELRTRLAPDAGWVMADPSQMEAALINLATNARDAMAQGGVLFIETARADAGPGSQGPQSILPAGSYVRIVVKDNGHGMDAETQQRIFEPFFTTKERGKGTGLGLSSVYGTVEQNGGRIFVESEAGEGSTFSIYLPRFERGPSSEVEPATANGVSRGTETILLVEDEAPVRRMLREALSNAGYRVWESGDGIDALDHWGAQIERIDLVVTDVVMPVMSGLKLAEELRKRRKDIKVIFMSGHSDEILDGQGALDPSVGLLEKPFVPSALVRKVREILDEESNRDRCPSRDV